MRYRVKADLAFSDPDEARDFFHDCTLALPKAVTINSGQETEERGFISLEQCFHDENPATPCNLQCNFSTE